MPPGVRNKDGLPMRSGMLAVGLASRITVSSVIHYSQIEITLNWVGNFLFSSFWTG